MKFSYFFIVTLILTISNFAQTTYFIKYKNSISLAAVDQKISEQKISNVLTNRPVSLPSFNITYLAKGLGRGDEVLGRIVKVQFSDNVDEANFNSILSSDTEIEYIQKSTTYTMDLIPNDSLLSQQWALEKIDAFDAWDITQGADTVLLAIIDTGIEYFHPDLKNKIYKNPGEIGTDNLGRDKSSNGIDDDNNDFIDDYMGWDFTDRVGVPSDTVAGDFHEWDNMPYDFRKGSNGNHGTFVAGIAGAEFNNISGVAGVAPKVKLLNIRSFDNGGNGEEDDAASAILYAVKLGAKVINMSWGDYTFSYVLRDVIRYAYSQNVVLVASSGNSGDNELHYPSGYSEVISVGNSTEEDYVAGNSTWGSTLDLVAPGSSIISTNMELGYISSGGTSASAPFVSASAALILSLDNFTNEEVKQIIKSTTDDILTPGWDLKSGAGRLNLERALRVLAPSNIKISFPLMDFATSEDSIPIVATVLSANFVSYNLEVGQGIAPDNWISLIENGLNQFSEKEIYNFNVSNYEEGTYTLRLVVNSNNGNTMEERVIFHILRSPPEVVEVGLGPIYYGDRSTIGGEFYTNQLCVMKMYYRRLSETEFNFISLDGFNTNNQFVKQLHYGFIPKDLVLPSTSYEIYFEAENLAGLKTKVVDSLNNNGYFQIPTENLFESTMYNQMAFSLSNSVTLFDQPVSFLSGNSNEILSQPFKIGSDVIFFNYTLENDHFAKNESDSLLNRYPLLYGDFNNNGLKDLITISYENITLLEQSQPGSFSFIKKDSTTKLFYPILIDELVNDGNYYLITENYTTIKRTPPLNDSLVNRYLVWRVNPNLTTTLIDSTFYIAKPDTFGSNITSRSMLVDDIDNDGTKEIWFIDEDGDLKSFLVNSNLTFTKSDSFYTSGLTPVFQRDILSMGDYNGDGIKDIAVLYNTNSIAPTFLLLIITFENHVPKILTQKVFLDQSEGYGGGLSFGSDIYQSLKFVDIDDDAIDELVLNMFPYSYILKFSNQGDRIIFYKEGSNTEHVFVGDINQNGVQEIGLKINEISNFFEFSNSIRTAPPGLVKGYSIDSMSIRLTWIAQAERYYIYKGIDASDIKLIDSLVLEPFYIDMNVDLNKTYYYAIKAFNPIQPEPLSGLSNIVEVYSHTPAKPDTAFSNSNRTVIVKFSEKINTTIENLESFEIKNFGFPNSISPYDQYSYLISFNDNLPVGSNILYVNNLKDLYGSPIESDSISFMVNEVFEIEDFFISSFEILDQNNLKIIFNLELEENSITDLTNYAFNPDNKVVSAKLDPTDKKVLYLNIDKNKPIGSIGIQYTLQLKNISSTEASGKIAIGEGAGSYIVLTKFAENLSDVYVYPNPVRDNGSDLKITFANLPQYARVTIWTIDGVKINELEEKNGDGGLEFNLRNFNGDEIGSGIYFYRVIKQDELGEELEEKIGKFAVIK